MSELSIRPIPALCVGKFSVYPTGLMLLGEPEWEEWEAFFKAFGRLGDVYRWVMGDALRKVEIQYGEAAEQLTAMFPEYEYHRLRDYRYVSESVAFAVRTASLSWSHHRAVAKLHPRAQEFWLESAQREEWDARELSKKIRGKEDEPETCECPTCGHVHKTSLRPARDAD